MGAQEVDQQRNTSQGNVGEELKGNSHNPALYVSRWSAAGHFTIARGKEQKG